LIYNQAETQSQDAFEVVKKACSNNGMELLSLPVNSSADSKIVTEALLSKGIDVFFALPDNVIFSSFETIAKSCEKSNVPIFTSEAGLVSRGAVASYGADFYRWGYQSGEQASNFLKNNNNKNLQPEEVKLRVRVINKQKAEQYVIIVPQGFEAIDGVSK
jgi:putative ABC transport system substrate-binding protein